MTLRVGIVGAGANTRRTHLPGFLAIEGVEVVAVCNRTQGSAQRVADEFGIPRVYEDWKELVRAGDVDAVCIGTWPYMHHPVTMAALEAGKHVLTEARIAMNLDQAREMRAAAARSDRVAMVVPAPWFLETEPALLEMIAAGDFGDWLEIHVSRLVGSWDPAAPIHWRQRRDLSGDNIMSLGILNETVRRYAGDDVSLVALSQTFVERRDDPDGGTRVVDVPDSLGVVSTLSSGATAVYHLSRVTAHGEGTRIELHGTRGAIRLAGGMAYVAFGSEDGFHALDVVPERRGGWNVEADFVDAIRDGEPVTRTSFDDAVKYMAFTDAVQTSLGEGRRVDVPRG